MNHCFVEGGQRPVEGITDTSNRRNGFLLQPAYLLTCRASISSDAGDAAAAPDRDRSSSSISRWIIVLIRLPAFIPSEAASLYHIAVIGGTYARSHVYEWCCFICPGSHSYGAFDDIELPGR